MVIETQNINFPDDSVWVDIQHKIVAVVKNSATIMFHKSPQGEAFILKLYAWGEEATELALPCSIETLCEKAAWLEPLLLRHLADEERHSKLLHARIAEIIPNYVEQKADKVDMISQYKLNLMRKLTKQYESKFAAGILVPMYGAAWCAERMVERVLSRHISQLPADSVTAQLLMTILHDERQHIRFCQETLTRLTTDDEHELLTEYLEDVLKIERKFNILGSGLLWCISVGFLIKSFIRPIKSHGND